MYLLVALLLVAPIQAEELSLVVHVSPVEPMVMLNKEAEQGVEGFDIDLMNAVAKEMGATPIYEVIPEFQYVLDGVTYPFDENSSDASMAGITITAEREEYVDFSHAYYDSGLSMAVQNKGKPSVWSTVVALFESKGRWLLYLLGFILFCGHIIWFTDRGNPAISDKYFPGIFEAFWFTLVTMTTVGYGDFAPKKWLTRIVTAMVMLAGIGIFGIIIAELSSINTVQKLESGIECPADLRGKNVATVAGCTSVPVLEKYGARITETPVIRDAVDQLLAGEVEVVVYDTPVLLYYVNKHQGLVIAGEKFEIQHYGIALPEGSMYREHINRALLKLRENGTYDKIYSKWFNEK